MTVPSADGPAVVTDDPVLTKLQATIEHSAQFLPCQGPITVFVHHNTLQAFEHLGFDDGVTAGGQLFDCNAWLPEDDYRAMLPGGRIRVSDLEAALLDDLGDEADRLVGTFGTRFALRLAMLEFPFGAGSTAELRWMVAETNALRSFRSEVDPAIPVQMIANTRRSVLRHLTNGNSPTSDRLSKLAEGFHRQPVSSWDETTWEAFVLHCLWRVCNNGIRQANNTDPETAASAASDCLGQQRPQRPQRPQRDGLLAATGEDSDLWVHDVLIRFCSAFLDQGFADAQLPSRERGLFGSFLELYGHFSAVPCSLFAELRDEAQRIAAADSTPLACIQESLTLLGISAAEHDDFITQSLLALRGWAGMVWQMETNASWAPHPAPQGSLVEFLAARLILDRIALQHIAQDTLGYSGPLQDLRDRIPQAPADPACNVEVQRAFTIFQLAQVRGWLPVDLEALSAQQWATLVAEIESFPASERRRIYHHAYERNYRNQALDAVIAHSRRLVPTSAQTPLQSSGTELPPVFQIACCIDDREESFRRHIEEVCPESQTFGVAGFFGAAMYYRGAGGAHFKPLCPVSIVPEHFVVEEPLYSLAEVERRRSGTRRRVGQLTHRAHMGSRTFVGGILTTLGGSFAAFPLVGRILFPRTAARIHRAVSRIVEPPATELRIERLEEAAGSSNGSLGFSVDEMIDIVDGVLRCMGLTSGWSRIILIIGHGATGLNNPHESAYNCGACCGSQGGPNARAFALMANDFRVRRALAARGLQIPESTCFVGGYHDTTNDSVTFADLDRVPVSHRQDFEFALQVIDEARARNAHERCRRFESTTLAISVPDALRHVEDRPEDLSQARPEYNHATNALCVVGRRAWNRGLMFDRRAFLTSYDRSQDDERGSILEGILQAVIPVCGGINLEYYFSTVDVEGYGCGSKLPHNITSLLGVMSGAASDLRPGLSAQMTEIHEPMRILFIIESTPQALLRIIDENAGIAALVKGNWVQLAVFDPETQEVQRFVDGAFSAYTPEANEIPTAESSMDWYRGQRDHLGFASIVAAASGQGGVQ